MQLMDVVALGTDPTVVQPVLLLQERAGRRRVLPVWVGVPEAAAIELARRHVETPRPQSHQLIVDVVRGFERSLEQVRITMLRDSIFHAELVFDGDTRVSARVSDAVAVALHLDIPIHAEDDVLDQAAISDARIIGGDADPDADPELDEAEKAEEAEQLERFRRFLDNASPEDFGPAPS